jgi:predicted GNAT family acetyltransferase
MTEDRQHDDDKLDETIEETFPASDAPGNTVETGVIGRLPATELREQISDNPARSRFELRIDGHTAFLAYERTKDSLTLVHTEVPVELRGRHFGEALVEGALEIGRREGLRIVVVCPFARAYLRRHPPSPPLR